MRDDYVINVKYTALLLRKHWNNVNYLKIFVKQQYTTILLLLSVVLSFISLWFMLIYIIGITYKNIKQRTCEQCWMPIVRDMVFLWALIFFKPSQHELEYKRV